ncbi:Low temperature viability protein [Lipomyces arxii]|uniref:Low temperature viability protein n=1 Tax=Lipomyces arxii TaxID=56418 RepID=UPI0034CD3DA2
MMSTESDNTVSATNSNDFKAAMAKRIDRKTARRYRLVYRSLEDPLINDPEASTGVLVEIKKKDNPAISSSYRQTGPSQIKTLRDLEADRGSFGTTRDNEGEAAMYGIGFDDSNYDYMQHLREIGRDEDGSTVFISSVASQRVAERANNRAGQSVKFVDSELDTQSSLPADLFPSTETVKRTYQDQQAIPDEIAGLQPDMDPALREVLEALEDEEYVEDDEDIFAKIITGEGADDDEDYEDDDGLFEDDEAQDQDWQQEFSKFKISQSKGAAAPDSEDEFDENDDVGSLVSFGSKRGKAYGGSRTASTGFSMSSSAMFRNAGLTLLDDRFDQIEKLYNESSEDEEDCVGDDAGLLSEVGKPTSTVSESVNGQQQLNSASFNAIMDDFLDNYSVVGKRLLRESTAAAPEEQKAVKELPNIPKHKNGRRGYDIRNTRGLNQLREIRSELGKPQTDYVKRRYKIAD